MLPSWTYHTYGDHADEVLLDAGHSRGSAAMESMSFQEMVTATGGAVLSTSLPDRLLIKGVSTDSRAILPGEIFFALQGEHFDGQQFVNQAVEKGAVAAVVSRRWADQDDARRKIPMSLIAVSDPLLALQNLAAHYRAKFPVTVVGITGTNGKTTTKDMVASVLASRFVTMKTEGNLNNQIGVSLTLLRLSGADEVAVVEMGMSGMGEIRRSAELSCPRHGLITNIGPAHLMQMGSLEAIARAKFELLESLPSDGLAFLNCDDRWLMSQQIVPSNRVVTFGMAAGAAYRATNLVTDRQGGTAFHVVGQGDFWIPTLGQHNIYNALAAVAVGRELGVHSSVIATALSKFTPSPMRMEQMMIGGVTILNDAYNANPASMRAALEVLSQTSPRGRRVAVLGDMRELGREELKAHREVGRWVARSNLNLLVTVGSLALEIAREARENGFPVQNIISCPDAVQSADQLKDIIRPGDALLLKASRAVRLEDILPVLSATFQED